MSERLSLATLPRVPASRRPRVDPGALPVGIVHLGIGAFHRAHQALFTEDAVAAAGGEWGICGVSQRSRAAVHHLAPQDGLYTVLVRDVDMVDARVVGTVRELLFAGDRTGDVLARMADPAVHIITSTVTEKGYRHDPATGRLRRDDAAIQSDVDGGAPRTVVGQIVRGVQARMHTVGGPLTVLCCDNLSHNGNTLSQLVADFVEMLPESEATPLASWLADHVRFPNGMVDRIVPAATAADRAAARELIGLDDEAVVVTEPFRQWVIEDGFPGGRPAWERAGVLFTHDVTPYEVMKLRMLNGAHSTLAYLGALAGCETVSETMGHEAFATVAQMLMELDVLPTLYRPDGVDLREYERELLARFANPALRHRTVQIAMDGSQKLPQRLLATVRARRATGAEPRWAAFAVAAWMRWVWSETADDGSPRILDDPLAPVLRAAVRDVDNPADAVERLLALPEVFGDDLREDAVTRRLLTEALRSLTLDGALAAAKDLTKGPA